MKIVLDIKLNGELKNNDIIIFKNGNWTTISKESFLENEVKEQKQKNDLYEKQIEKLQKDLVNLAKIVKEK